MTEQLVERAVPEQQADTSAHTDNPELESLATGVELTLASVLQGIAVAILIPKIVDLITSGELAKLPYIPASLLLIFIMWVAFIGHALSFKTWPFDPIHNMLYFLIVTAEMVLLTFLDQPSPWFLSLLGFSLITAINYWYNQRLLQRQMPRYARPAARALYNDMVAEQSAGLRFMAGYCLVGMLGFVALRLRPEYGLPPELGWVVTGLIAVTLPAIHVAWQSRLMARRAGLIERAQAEAAAA
jgi:hypothetical protein